SAGPALDVTSALTLRGVTVEGVNEGTTAISNAGTLTMDLAKAGAVINAGTLNARFSTLAALTNSGDATLERAFTGAVSNTGTLTLRTSTLYTTDDLGVGLQGGSFIAENATIVAEEQGVQVAGGVARLYSSLVVAPTPVSDTFDDDGFNLLVTSLDEAGLSAPADNDGNVPTMALAVGSPAVDAGDCSMSSVNTDARGYGRPLNIRGYPNAADGCDIGALEAAVIDVQRTAPVAQFSTTPPDGIAPLAVRFDASATTDAENDIVQFAWEFGDGDSESGERVTHTYRAPGTYTVKLVVTDASGLEGTASSNVVVEEAVNESPRARFSASTTRGTAPLSVRFDATASSDPDGSVDAYNWTFGDGRTGTGATIEHRYATPGSYSVRLIVADDDGATGSSTIQIVATEVDGRITSALRQNDSYAGARDTKILAAEPEQVFGNDPILEADGGPDEASILAWDLSSIPPTSEVESVELVFTFEDESQSSYEIYEMKRAWVEDETTWNEYAEGQPWQTPGAMGEDDRGSDVLGVLEAEKIVGLNEAGIAVVEQWIRDPSTNNGFILEDYESSVDGVRFFSKETTVETDRPQIVVRYRKGSEQQEPEARIAATPAEGEAPLFVRFDGSDSTDPDGTIVTYAWDFGDEITAFGEETTHTFVEAGEYTVTLTLTDNAGNIGTGQVTIRALDPDNAAPIASFSTEIDPDDPTLYTFDARASADPDGQIETYEWDFGDGEMGQGEVVEHRFELGPTYPVTLTVTDDDGASASATLPVVTDTEVFGVPEAFALLDNYPNPFNPTTRLGYALPEQATVTLTVFDYLGRIVAVLVQRQQQPAGTYTLDFDAANLPSGTYFYRLETDAFAETKRML
ncbi:MAG: PKD domain-containing protein, partial [Bacteroidota bacterium]